MKNPVRIYSESLMPTAQPKPAAVVCGWIIVIGTLLLLAAVPAFSADSPMFGGNTRHNSDGNLYALN